MYKKNVLKKGYVKLNHSTNSGASRNFS